MLSSFHDKSFHYFCSFLILNSAVALNWFVVICAVFHHPLDYVSVGTGAVQGQLQYYFSIG